MKISIEWKPEDVPLKYAGGEVVVCFNSVQENKGAIDKDRFQKMVTERAYCKSEKRGVVGRHEMGDWLETESEIKNQYFYWFQNAE